MILKRLTLLFTAVAMVATLGSGTVQAKYPEKPITLIIPFGPGGSHDMNARVFTSVIPEFLGNAMIVKLMPGASGQKGTARAIKSRPDGYTLLFTHNFIDQLQRHVENLPYDTLKSLKTVWKLNDADPIIYTRGDRPWKNMKDMMAYGKKNPGKLVFPNSGKWGAGFTAGAVILAAAGVQAKFIPYKGGGPARRALLAGDGDFTVGRPSHIKGNARAGKIRVLGLAGAKRLKAFPELPTFKEQGYPSTGMTMDRIIQAPAKTPQDRIDTLRTAFKKLYKAKTFKKLLKKIGENSKFMSGDDYDKNVRPVQSAAYKKLVKKLTSK